MELSVSLFFAGLVINRIIEGTIKKMLPPEGTNAGVDRFREAVILNTSFIAGAVLVVIIYPNENMFPGAISPVAGQIFTGVLVGGIANGWDFLMGAGEKLITRNVSQQTITVERQFSASSSTQAPHDLAA